MNRHVSKRVCLGLHFQTPTYIEEADDDDTTLAVQPIMSSLPPSSPCIESVYDHSESQNSVMEMPTQGKTTKSSRVPCSRVPCPYCNKLLKGERGVKKHIDFYGCPMAVGAKSTD
ncbi:hypothetical protein TNIN_132771 [Trichonephila inaurata madagascariensis]|uniref:Uncharacterized protein n=1 Tax=Trichonephila inaurata madagascariensis TaxID=2747483 RepID=A0A8X6YK64_9ARAC|nr:hypothetical protein TNIN_132771 [Trichonephila inaurata madagascariensis]